MNRKTYLRGLGLGLIVASLVTGVGSRQTMSDEQIKARAKELGMVEGNTYLTRVNESEETAESLEVIAESVMETETQAETMESETETETAAETGEPESAGETGEPESAAEETAAETEETTTETEETVPETVTFQIRSGDSSVSVAKRLAELGLVGDAKVFDQYLCQNGYDKKIRVGTYEIQMDSSNEEIAKSITSGK